jgi:hypothetical protein
MNPFEMVAVIVVAVMIAGVLRAKYSHSRRDLDPQERLETERLRDEVTQLKERLHVLERIATETENTLARQIEELRDR